ncbi:Uncharacterized protein OBRU01_15717 [Operophtera brumata]|uniref:FLYWCH-type domain-containing protein n=1 Tax=Operophtera brumata TaxID=104452 RepID=A0A0L7KPN8_OPEBR|nr:Uncharacterized protein OBRU01_23260 [Operophtera brumata]KOB70196.1 Uncharacterized protein OBRU01_15717 [Operophtera brumata]
MNMKIGEKVHWRCSTRIRGCRALIHTVNDTIVKIINVHNHPIKRERLKYKVVATVTWSRSGHPIISIGGYRFCKRAVKVNKIHWRCSTAKRQGCRAVLHTTPDLKIVKDYNFHNHEPHKQRKSNK